MAQLKFSYLRALLCILLNIEILFYASLAYVFVLLSPIPFFANRGIFVHLLLLLFCFVKLMVLIAAILGVVADRKQLLIPNVIASIFQSLILGALLLLLLIRLNETNLSRRGWQNFYVLSGALALCLTTMSIEFRYYQRIGQRNERKDIVSDAHVMTETP
ncbi:unnamed protein product, partial [Mesorhabditis belari]|uniref:Uncharacterized protein n=1 Tax=Mesorhabditis belari TaxID=2138241 RepID=A0AAF3ESY2_9BILA